VTGGKHELEQAFPPDYVSAETLAYRLDCSRSTVGPAGQTVQLSARSAVCPS